jgi:hypothetical protein
LAHYSAFSKSVEGSLMEADAISAKLPQWAGYRSADPSL